MKGNFAALVLILVGAGFLASNLGWLNFSMLDALKVWWPVVLIVLGVGMFFMPRERIDGSDKS
jgi:uncharacterized membrane protein YhhN